ncbi:SIMPL domain-containing protein [Actinoplanes oblitus]|uniref:SIMPL domain-containing protein n=1 Tax=Actinoplanes oblitus TaxID=3040509 RepID=A0ABY8WVG5_9ACTN|nr:SIMPL domain-containing protein [Actinoplanes oblitus]WIN00963.1 SIMPL domain-containing protein [Actinoplanes oblitus]
MERLPIVVATGEAVREVPPELATVHVHTVAKGRDREAVLRRLAERSAAAGAVLDEFAAAIERRETTGVQVHPQTKRRGEGVAEYHGSVGTRVLVTDFTVLGDLLLRLAGEELTSVSGPYWQLRPGSRAGAEARRAAVTEALVQAAEYAAAVGARVDRLIEISDVFPAEGFPMAVGGRAMSDSGTLELEPEPQTVHARVRVTVTTSEPTLPI